MVDIKPIDFYILSLPVRSFVMRYTIAKLFLFTTGSASLNLTIVKCYGAHPKPTINRAFDFIDPSSGLRGYSLISLRHQNQTYPSSDSTKWCLIPPIHKDHSLQSPGLYKSFLQSCAISTAQLWCFLMWIGILQSTPDMKSVRRLRDCTLWYSTTRRAFWEPLIPFTFQSQLRFR